GEVLQEADGAAEALLVADIDLTRADHKERLFIPGEYELDLMADRRPELYRSLVEADPQADVPPQD
ncbi:MAG: hypothetical protein MUO23_12035, partial [Anaerolineales bacterium]|nr:hypothetical protein [Anaerolineales bacterium]